MKSNIRPRQLEANLTARVSALEAERVKVCAAAANLSVSEWVRRTLLEAINCPPWVRLLLGEFLALRSVVVDLQRDLMQSVTPSNDRVKAILEVADTRKFALADGRLAGLPSTKEASSK